MPVRRYSSILLSITAILLSCAEESNEQLQGTGSTPNSETCTFIGFGSSEFSFAITRDVSGKATGVELTNTPNSLKISSIFEYDDLGRIVKIIEKDAYRIYEYNTNGRLISNKEYILTYPSTSEYKLLSLGKYTYNAAGKVDSSFYTPVMGLSVPEYRRYEYNANGTLVKIYIKSGTAAEQPRSEYLTWDDKHNPGMPYDVSASFSPSGATGSIQTRLSPISPFERNTLTARSFRPDGSPIDITIKYDYNEWGYPISSMTNSNSAMNYTYECK